MPDENIQSEDTPERVQEKREHSREAQERAPGEGSAGERARNEDPAEESVIESVPTSTANKPTG